MDGIDYQRQAMGLSIGEILEYFPEECAKLIPRSIRNIRADLEEWIVFERLLNNTPLYKHEYIYIKWMFDMRKPKDKFTHLQRLEAMKRIMKSPDGITPDMIETAKKVKIKDLYSWIKPTIRAKRFSACCPFHNEDTPSFYIMERNQYHCFGCSVHGDVIDFVMKTRGLNFKDAVKFLLESR